MGDLKWMRENGLEGAVKGLAEEIPVFGVCGGYQMRVTDDCNINASAPLPVKTLRQTVLVLQGQLHVGNNSRYRNSPFLLKGFYSRHKKGFISAEFIDQKPLDYQMLGEEITDSEGIEEGGSMRGMGLLPVKKIPVSTRIPFFSAKATTIPAATEALSKMP